MSNTYKSVHARQRKITADYLKALDEHLQDIVDGRATEMYEIRDIASLLHLHPTHMADTIKLVTGKHACYFFEEKILAIAKRLIEQNEENITAIATRLTYDPSNFTKFFKSYTSLTPKQYREQYLSGQSSTNTVMLTKKTVTITKANAKCAVSFAS